MIVLLSPVALELPTKMREKMMRGRRKERERRGRMAEHEKVSDLWDDRPLYTPPPEVFFTHAENTHG